MGLESILKCTSMCGIIVVSMDRRNRLNKEKNSTEKRTSLKKGGTLKRQKQNNLGLYTNLAHRMKEKKDSRARERAEYLASLPKDPVKRFFYKLHPKRVLKYWFSKQGLFMGLKILGAIIILTGVAIAAAFAYVSKDLNQIKPE